MQSKEQVVEQYRVRSIQEAALRVIAKTGLAGASMQAIADEAGIAKGTIYLYFENRDDLVERTADLAFDQLQAQLQPTLAGPGAFAERLTAFIRIKLAFFHHNREFFRVYLALCDPHQEVAAGKRRHRRRDQYRDHLARVSAFLQEGIDRGEVRAFEVGSLAFLLCEAIHAIMLRRLGEAEPPAPEVDAQWIASVFLGGLAAGARS